MRLTLKKHAPYNRRDGASHDHDGAIDCDIHPGVPNIKALLPYMNEFWQETFVARGIDGFDMMSYPLDAPITCRPDWRVKGERPGSSLGNMRRMRWMHSASAWRSATR